MEGRRLKREFFIIAKASKIQTRACYVSKQNICSLLICEFFFLTIRTTKKTDKTETNYTLTLLPHNIGHID